VRPVGFELAIPASEVPQTRVLDSAVTTDDIILQTVLPAFQVRVLIWTGDSGSNPERAHGDKSLECQ